MIKNLSLILLLFIALPSYSDVTPFIQGEFHNNKSELHACGYMQTTNTRYIKSSCVNCKYEKSKCYLYTATYVSNSLYPDFKEYDIIQNKNGIRAVHHNTDWFSVDLSQKTINFSNNSVIHTNQEQINKLLGI